jgi:hypothetical protein
MKKQKKTNQTLQHFSNVALSLAAQAKLKGGCGCGPDSDDGHPPPPPPKKTTAAGSQALPEAWGN